MDSTRAASLKKAFKAYLDGNRTVSTLHEARIFFEAVKLQQCPSECLEHIIGSKAGLKAVRQSARLSLEKDYIRQSIFPFLWFFSDPEVKALYDGTFLQQLITVFVNPPTAWNNIVRIYKEDTILHAEAESKVFAWLCYQVVSNSDPDLANVVDDVVNVLKEHPLLDLPWDETRASAYLIQKALDARKSGNHTVETISGQECAGGRHDNDFSDFRETRIYPTPDELASSLKPFLRTAQEVAEASPSHRSLCHLDNQFRLYRADFVDELKEGISAIINDKKQGNRRGEVLKGLKHAELVVDARPRASAYCLSVSFSSGLSFPPKLDEAGRCDYLRANTRILGDQNLGILFRNKKVIAFAFVVRRAESLATLPPIISLDFVSVDDYVRAVQGLQNPENLQFAVIDTPWYAYEPVLKRLKQIEEIPLQNELFMVGSPPSLQTKDFQPTEYIRNFVTACREKAARRQEMLIVDKSYTLDEAQAAALTYALESPLSVIQGPPGTGKSFIGALVVKLLLQSDSSKVLVITFTNHSTNQMLEDLLEIGVSSSLMTRLGSKFKATSRTEAICFESQVRSSSNLPKHGQWARINSLKTDILDLRQSLESAVGRLRQTISPTEMLDFLELDEDERSHEAWAAFQPPSLNDNFKTVGRTGRVLTPEEMITKWQKGQGPDPVRRLLSKQSQAVWNLSSSERQKLTRKWSSGVRKEQIESVTSLASQIQSMQKDIDGIFSQGKRAFAASRRVIGCTTTSAARNMALLKAFQPTCILVEEAGEILEPHVLAALCPSTKQLILIGDHQQLRPKCNSYPLSVEKGDGYDLNRSLFERLIRQGQRHETLQRQHRMAPDISQFVRSLTYPDLLDGRSTLDRPQIRGLSSRVMFINHGEPEGGVNKIGDKRDEGSKVSRENRFEAEMVLRIVKYLGQQGYKSSDIVVLTPYLGQLRLLRDMLSKENDPVLNDLDSAELLRAGLLTQAAAKLNRSQIKLSSIDNYQGEESDIVVASLTRSNKKGDIGFMKAPERLNVLISRARNCLVMMGNMETFLKAPNEKKVWHSFFDQLKDNEFLHDGLRVRCERHPEQTAMLSTPNDFAEKCPEGGCNKDCNVALSCGVHVCKLKCHRLSDHSKVSCEEPEKFKCKKGHEYWKKCSEPAKTTCDEIEKTKCEKGHDYTKKCSDQKKRCPVCAEQEEAIRRQVKRDLELEKARLDRQEKYRRELQEIKDEIASHERQVEIEEEEGEERRSIAEHRIRLKALRRAKQRSDATKKASDESNGDDADAVQENGPARTKRSAASDEWESMKRNELARSAELDDLMRMIGLEGVKRTFLDIKSQIDVALQQGVSVGEDRFSCTLLGNPGTGKTTVARIYGKFLAAMGILPGNSFEETTGSKLANMGVSGCQNLIDGVLNKGGGIIFIDEAYQLSSGNSSGGAAVLDFLLAEVENLRSKIVFILAGYAKQMESFFSHNPGFPSRFPLEMKFEDYSDEELLDILALQVHRRFKGSMKVEDGLRGLYCRIISRRLGRGRGKQGFGNARAVENALAGIYRNQARRIKNERHKAGLAPDALQLINEDIIGPRPSQAVLQSKAWSTLQELVGLQSVKESVQALVDTLESNYERELAEKPIVEYSLNRLFLGSPGTGKTTVAKLYGELLAQIGILSNGGVVVKSPADFVGDIIGASEKITKGILDSTVGKVLVIDEAYGFYGGGRHKGGTDIFKTAVIDTIVANVDSTPGDDRCILLLGYRDQMRDMLQNINRGLSRRFPLKSAFMFEDFDAAQMATVFEFKLKKQGYSVTPKAEEVALRILERARCQPNFGNAGEVDILLDEAKLRHQKRLSANTTKRRETLEALDFDAEYDRGSKADVTRLFDGAVGCEKVVSLLQGYQVTVRQMQSLEMDPKDSIPFNFLFRGPPGTGKTSTARKMGKVFYDAGILASDEVVEVSTSDIIGKYVGHTGPQVRGALDKALGKVLFIDEAYRLAAGGGGHNFAQEALDEIVDACTKERYHKKLIIILAGYENDINRLLTANSGLSSRFPEVVDFQALEPSSCLELLVKELTKKKKEVEASGAGNHMKIECLYEPVFREKLIQDFNRACRLDSWANARDVLTVSASIFNAAIRDAKAGFVNVTAEIVNQRIKTFMDEKESRNRSGKASKGKVFPTELHAQTADSSPAPTQAPSGSSTTAKGSSNTEIDPLDEPRERNKQEKPDTGNHEVETTGHTRSATRDAGVSDEVWEQLQRDVREQQRKEEEYQDRLRAEVKANYELRQIIVKELSAEKEKRDEEHRSRIRAEKQAIVEMKQRIAKQLHEEQRRMEYESKVKSNLHMRGLCPAGYTWIHQLGGWRCAGGAHWVSDADASIM